MNNEKLISKGSYICIIPIEAIDKNLWKGKIHIVNSSHPYMINDIVYYLENDKTESIIDDIKYHFVLHYKIVAKERKDPAQEIKDEFIHKTIVDAKDFSWGDGLIEM